MNHPFRREKNTKKLEEKRGEYRKMLCGLSSRGTLILLNFVFFSVGLVVLSVGLWSQYDKNFSTLWNTFEISKIIDARGLNGASLLLIVSGLSSVIVSFAGLYGSIKKEKCFLTTYCLFICVILILEVSAASVFVAYQSQARDKLRDGLNKTVAEINKDYDKGALQVMNTIQTVFKCCGCDGKNDYLNVTAITSCETSDSTPTNPKYYENGCFQTILSYLNSHLPIIMGISIAMILFQVFCLIVSVRLCTIIQYDGYEDI